MFDAWWEEMACRDADPQIFEEPAVPQGKSRASWIDRSWYKPALAICAECPVRERCLDEALRTGETEHQARLVIGGLTPDQFVTLQRRRAAR